MVSRTMATLLIAASVVSFAPTTTAQLLWNVGQCLASIRSVKGCTMEIANALLNPQASTIGASCCKAIDGLSASCLLSVFPGLNTGSIIKSICALGGGSSPPPGTLPSEGSSPSPGPTDGGQAPAGNGEAAPPKTIAPSPN